MKVINSPRFTSRLMSRNAIIFPVGVSNALITSRMDRYSSTEVAIFPGAGTTAIPFIETSLRLNRVTDATDHPFKAAVQHQPDETDNQNCADDSFQGKRIP